ncbi:hypothetical protein D5R81_18435 [Parashewanella spongiae]|uniref:Uncharacterized protein n=1 Tax=Parashewanella spongiae TaxID=342950 RepID=A0A3A6T455_9GAMM|nr:hypothetical protein [Parashewanella spongiae]MCL1080046.1 hypothetical protein [Parashewanella spongiae]RJY05846.1 hypothetical protein D5R81_18435 [Parashewanella spongiae]
MATNLNATLNQNILFHTSKNGQLLEFSQAHFDHINSLLSSNADSLTLKIKSPRRMPETVTYRVRASSTEYFELRRLKAFLGCVPYERYDSQTREIERVYRQFQFSPAMSKLYSTALGSPRTDRAHGVTLKTGYCTLNRVLKDLREMPRCNLVFIEAEGIFFHDRVAPSKNIFHDRGVPSKRERERECEKTYRLSDNFIPDFAKFKSENPTVKFILMSQDKEYLSCPEFKRNREECLSLFDAELSIVNTEQLTACVQKMFNVDGEKVNASVVAFNESTILSAVSQLIAISRTSTSVDKPVEVGCAYQYVANLGEQYSVLAFQQGNKTVEEFFHNNADFKYQYDTWRFYKDKICVVA